MVNRQQRDPGQIRRLDVHGRVSGEVPSFAVDTGAAARALAEVAGNMSDRLGKMAAEAAEREGELAGLDVGARSGAAYLQLQAAQAAAAGKAAPADGAPLPSVHMPENIRAIVTSAAERYGVAPDALLRIAMIESSGNPKAKNPSSSAGGLFQFIDSTAAEYGLKDRFDPAQAADAGARLARDNAAHLRKVLGRDPTAGELYLAHQQGAGGAAKLLGNPDADAVATVGADAVRLNGGKAGMTNREFASLWLRKAGDTPAVSAEKTASVKVDAPAVPVLPTTPLALRRDGSIYSEAYNRSAINAYSWRMQAGVEADIAAAAMEHPDDPAALAGALAKVQDKYGRDPNLAEPELREAFQKRFAERSQAYLLDAQAKAEAKMRETETAAAFEGVAAQRLGIERQAVALGANAKGDEIIAREVEKAGRAIDGAVASGALTPGQGAKQKAELAETAATARVRGVYEALPGAGEKEQFAIGLMEEWEKGKGPIAKLPYATAKALSDTLFNDARDIAGRQTTADKVEGSKIERLVTDDLVAMESTGKGLSPDSGLTADRVEKYLGPEKLAEWQAKRALATRSWQATAGMETQSPGEIGERIAVLDRAARNGGPGATDAAIALDAARKKAADVLKERETDPLGQASRAGAIDLKAIDLSSPDNLRASLAKRRDDALAVARLTGGKATYFQPGERAYLARVMTENPTLFPDFAMELTRTYGDQAATALGELSDDMPVMAHAAGLTIATGRNDVATDVAQALSAKAQGLWKTKIVPATQRKIVAAAGEAIGSSLAYVPKVKASAIAAAQLLFEADANRLGFDIEDVDEKGTAARASLERAIDRALGGSTVNGVKLGGVAEVNGLPVIVPPSMAADRPQALIEAISEAELAALPPIKSANGVPIEAWQLQGAHLVAFADGRYRVMLGDPDGPDPQRVLGADGRDWILDIRQLDALRQRAPVNVEPLGQSTRGNFR